MLPLTIDPMPIPGEAITFTGNLPPLTATISGGDVTFGQWLRSSFVTGNNSPFVVSSVTLRFREVTQDSNLFVGLYNDSNGTPGNQIIIFTNPSFTPDFTDNYIFTLSTPQLLLPNTTYWLVAGISSSGSGLYRWALTNSNNQSGHSSWSIGDSVLFSNNQSLSWTDFSGFTAAQFSINGQSYSPAAGDPYFSNVALLLKGNGENNSTNIVDSSSNLKSITATGNTRISTDQSRFGGSSILINSGTIQSNSSLDFAFDSEDFTIEGWVYLLAIPSSGFPNLFQTTDGLLYINFRQSGFFAVTTATAVLASSPSPIPLNQWSHFAITRSGSVFRVWLNGISGTPATANLTFASTATSIRLGDGFLETLSGYIDEYRVTKGVAREISLPTAPFPDL